MRLLGAETVADLGPRFVSCPCQTSIKMDHLELTCLPPRLIRERWKEIFMMDLLDWISKDYGQRLSYKRLTASLAVPFRVLL